MNRLKARYALLLLAIILAGCPQSPDNNYGKVGDGETPPKTPVNQPAQDAEQPSLQEPPTTLPEVPLEKPVVCGDGVCEGSEKTSCASDCTVALSCTHAGIVVAEGECDPFLSSMCENNVLVPNCSACGCPNLSVCGANNECGRVELSPPEYECTLCHGFCYTNDPNTESMCFAGKYFEWPRADPFGYGRACTSDSECSLLSKCIQSHCLTDLFSEPWGLPLEITVDYPRSIEKNQAFTVDVVVRNTGSEPIQVKIFEARENVLIEAAHAMDKAIDFNVTKTIEPGAIEEFSIPAPALGIESNVAEVRFSLSTDHAFPDIAAWEYSIPLSTTSLGPIIVYDSASRSDCSSLVFDSDNAVCVGGVLYPSSPGLACLSNTDCLGEGVCVNYTCVNPNRGAFSPDKRYKIGLVGLLIYEDASWAAHEASRAESDLRRLASEAFAWFADEKEFQRSESDFSAEYGFYDTCSLSKAEYLAAFSSCPSWGDCERKVAFDVCGFDFSEFDVIASHSYYEPGMALDDFFPVWNRVGVYGVSGINFGGGFLLFGLEDESGYPDLGVLIHESLHSFGMIDLYMENGFHNEFFQERNCNLFRARWREFSSYPHLCDFEAMVIGWKG